MITTAFLLLIVPLTIMQMGESAAVVGRLILLYFFGLFLLAANAERLASHWKASKAFVIVGATVIVSACLTGHALDGIWGMVAACVLLGVGQSLMAGSQGNLAIKMMAESAPAEANLDLSLGIYRFFDRIGAALGPVFAAVLIQQYGLREAMLWMAVTLGVCTLASLLTYEVYKGRGQSTEALT
jgi:MFS family permease